MKEDWNMSKELTKDAQTAIVPMTQQESCMQMINKIINEIVFDGPDIGIGKKLTQIVKKIRNVFNGSEESATEAASLLNEREKEAAIEYFSYLNDITIRSTDCFLSMFLVERRKVLIKALGEGLEPKTV